MVLGFPTVQLKVHNENPERCGRNTNSKVNKNTKQTLYFEEVENAVIHDII